MDLCGGLDVGVLDVQISPASSEKTVPYVAPGPSLDMRGELGGDIAVILRGVAGVNVVHQLDNTPILSGRGELAFSWSIQ
jgi:hypothetical protein